MSKTMNIMNIKKSVMDNLYNMNVNICKEKILECSKLYSFDGEEAVRRVLFENNVEKVVKEKVVKEKVVKEKVVKEKVVKEKVVKEKPVKSVYPMPFNNEKNEECCSGIRQNHGLYTQCENKMSQTSKYCKSCDKQAKKNEDGKPDYGDIDDRLAVGVYDYRDRKGKGPINYLKVLKKLKLNQEEALNEFSSQNKKILDCHLEGEPQKRGRPKAEKKVKESTGKKGRPKKSSKVVEVNSSGIETEDLFASLVANVVESKVESKVESNDEEVDVVKKFEHEGKQYLKSKKSGIVYNMDQDVIGKWNESAKSIDYFEDGELSDEDIDDE
jgi:hypothetical protein